MKQTNITKILFIFLATFFIISCSATPTRRSFKEGWKDSVISTKVKLKLTKDDIVKKRNFDVDVWRGVVTLTGRATSHEEKERAEQLSWQVKGVRGVDNFLKLVDDTYIVATDEKSSEEQMAETEAKEMSTTEVVTVETAPTNEKTASHPIKNRDRKVNNRVNGPVIYEDSQKVKEWRATRNPSDYNKPESSRIEEKDLTSEESLVREAAEELRRLRGEESISD